MRGSRLCIRSSRLARGFFARGVLYVCVEVSEMPMPPSKPS